MKLLLCSKPCSLLLKNSSNGQPHITNGTVMVVEKFYDSHISLIPAHPSAMETYSLQTIAWPRLCTGYLFCKTLF